MATDTKAAFRAIEDRADDARVTISALCKRANVSPSSPVHWRNGILPTVTTIGKLERALDQIERERGR